MRVLVTGSQGFIGKNLLLRLSEIGDIDVACFSRENSLDELPGLLSDVDFIFHLAGVNRPLDDEEFSKGNTDLTQTLVDAILAVGCTAPVIYTSSIQAELDNPYGESKRQAEDILSSLRINHGVPVSIFRLPNVFGKWSKPNYNSVVATFCYNIAHSLPIHINDHDANISLVYIDDVIQSFVDLLLVNKGQMFETVSPVYQITVGDLAEQLYSFKNSRKTLVTNPVGVGLTRALYATYLSFIPSDSFSYELPKYEDPRGVFVEMLKTQDSGQFSYFTALPGVTRGGHYHNTKSEKFLVIKGRAKFKFRHMSSAEYHELITEGVKPEIVETMPGWTHDITNIGDEELVVMLWANEIFDRQKPDTYTCALAGSK